MDQKINRKTVVLIVCVVLIIGVLSLLDIYQCPLDSLIGVPCMLCGITRAVLAALRGDFGMAFYYHPLWPVILLALILYIPVALGVIRPPKKLVHASEYILAALLLCCYIARQITGSPIVGIHFHTSVLYRVLHALQLVR